MGSRVGDLTTTWRCPVCRGRTWKRAFRSSTTGSEGGVDAARFRPASSDFGHTAGEVVRCATCGHGSLLANPDPDAIEGAYVDAADPVSLREEAGQVATARRDLDTIETAVGRLDGRLLDVGCWTGSFVAAAAERGFEATGIEPSAWAVARARERGLDVQQGTLADATYAAGTFRVIVSTDVLEHLLDPGEALTDIAELLEPEGVLFCTVPDSGGRVARLLGARWWAVLPMHVQYFTRASLGLLLASHGFEVCSMTSHPKLFSRRYYAERLAEFAPGVGQRAVAMLGRAKPRARLDALTSVNFGDRVAVVARKTKDRG